MLTNSIDFMKKSRIVLNVLSALCTHFFDKYSHKFEVPLDFENEEQIIEKLLPYIFDEVLLQANSVDLICKIAGVTKHEACSFLDILLSLSEEKLSEKELRSALISLSKH